MSKMLIETQWNVWKWRDKPLLFTGARRNEITHAKGEYINWDHGTLLVLALNPVGQGCLRPDASHAGRRPRYGETFQRHLRSAPLGPTIPPTMPSSARPNSATTSSSTAAPTFWRSSPTMPAAAGPGTGSRNTAIRVTQRSIQSTGSSAFRSPRRAITSSACWRTCRSTAPASTTAHGC
jgi:hypothetical protein